jgi:TRAP-type C4-dicarboxylate transport system permease small subunit
MTAASAPDPAAPPTPDRRPGAFGARLYRVAVALAFGGGAVIAAVGLVSAASIAGRTVLRRPILGDFELVEIGTAVAGSLFLPYCQATRGHVIVDFFTQRAGPRTIAALDRIGALLLAATFLAVAWRTAVGGVDIARSGETSMLMRIPIWIGYAAMLPGLVAAGLVALAQGLGVVMPERARGE